MSDGTAHRVRWQPLWWRWCALLWGCALALAALAIWRGGEVSARQQRVEQVAVLQEIGRALVSSLERAQQMGIPLQDTVGLEPWLAGQLSSSPQLSGLAVVMASGEVLAQHGVKPDALPSPDASRPQVSLAIAAPGQNQPAAWLHVVGVPHDRLWPQVLGTLVLAALAGVAATLTLRQWLRRHVGRRLARIRHHLMQMASGHLVSGHVIQPEPGHHEVALLDRALAHRWATVQQRQAALLQKLNEVRAAHFDTAVLARIDDLAAPLLQSPTTRPDTGSNVMSAARRGWRRWSLTQRVSVVLWSLWALALVGLVGLESLHASRAQEAQAQTQVMRLRMAFEQALGQDLARLSPWARPAVAETTRRAGPQTVAELLPAPAHWWMRVGTDDVQALAGREAEAVIPPTPTLLSELALRKDGTQGIWAGADRQLQVGVARQTPLPDGTMATLVVTQPLAITLDQLASSLQARLALADHRGQPLGADPARLVQRWQQAQREVMPSSEATWLVSVPLLSHTGHTLGHLVADLPTNSPPAGTSGSVPLLLALWLALGVGIWLVRQQLRPLGLAALDLARVAESPEAGSEDEVHVGALRRDIARVESRLEALRALRRSRERQGRRQARFIRHQMLELANRLDEAARADVLKDLERIESAGLHPATATTLPAATPPDPRFERMVDEVGVLALGFQNLVGRVGDQYQQLGQLVQELREALRVKTQFIAIQQELEIARKMQLTFLPHDFSNQSGVELHGVTQPAREVGGDFYDFFRLDEHHLAALVADVSGKGVPAAFFMAVSRTLMRAVAQFSQGPADCLQRLNDLLAADNEEMMFVTLFYAVIDTRTGEVVYGNAGHNPPYVVRADGPVEAVPSLGNMALAVMPGMPYDERTLKLNPGDALFLYTDGVTEASAPDGSWFGEPRLEAFLQASGRPAQVKALSHELIDTVKHYEAGGAQSDDITCLTVRLTPPPHTP